MIKAIIFDFFGVFTTDTWKVFCAGLPPEANLERARELNRMYDARLITHDDFVQQVIAATGATAQEIAGAQLGGAVIDTGLIDYIRELKKNYKIAILSNVGTNQIRDKLLSKEEQELIDVFIFSYEVGMVKPDPGIYQIALEKLGVEPNECIFTDDGERNVEAAEALGIKAFLYTDFIQFKHDLQSVIAED
jgi:putative hydrolase of the HAD superfamily